MPRRTSLLPNRRPLIVTRPAREAAQWVAQLQARGWSAQALPLIDIAPAPDSVAVRQAWQALAQFDALMCVSSNAVEQFFAARPADVPWTSDAAKPRWWVTGPGSQTALLAQGVPASAIDQPGPQATQLDSEALWAQVQPQVRAAMRVLIVRGTAAGADADAPGNGQGRDWLGARLIQAGAQLQWVVAYTRSAPVWDAARRAHVTQALAQEAVWLWSSSESLANLIAAFPGQSWQGAAAVATHPRIAQAARDAGFGRVVLAGAGLDALCASIESLG